MNHEGLLEMVESGTQQFEQVRCVQCGYLLRGLDRTGKCPECGLEIEESIRGSHLCNSDIEWLKKLRKGSLYLIWGMTSSLIALSLFYPVFCADDFRDGTILVCLRIALLAAGCGVALSMRGIFLLTSREGRSFVLDNEEKYRQTVRVSVVLTLASVLVVSACYLITPATIKAAWVVGLPLVVFVWSFMLHMNRLVFRVRASFLEVATQLIGWGCPLLTLLAVYCCFSSVARDSVLSVIVIGGYLLYVLSFVVCITFAEEFKYILRTHRQLYGSE